MRNIERKPILTVANKRNNKINPEFMDINALLIRFEPLMKNLFHRYVKFDTFNCAADRQELKDEITEIFLYLYHKWNPKIGVDFTGYIKKQFNDRVYQWVKERQLTRKNEVLVSFQHTTDDEDEDNLNFNGVNPLYKQIESEETSDYPYTWIDSCESCPWEILDEVETEICRKMLFERKDIQIIYSELNLKPMQGQRIFYTMLDKIYKHQSQKENEDEEELTKLAKEVSDLAEKVVELWNKKYPNGKPKDKGKELK